MAHQASQRRRSRRVGPETSHQNTGLLQCWRRRIRASKLWQPAVEGWKTEPRQYRLRFSTARACWTSRPKLISGFRQPRADSPGILNNGSGPNSPALRSLTGWCQLRRSSPLRALLTGWCHAPFAPLYALAHRLNQLHGACRTGWYSCAVRSPATRARSPARFPGQWAVLFGTTATSRRWLAPGAPTSQPSLATWTAAPRPDWSVQ